MEEAIRVVLDGQVGIITLNRPERHNAFTQAMHVALGEALDELAGDARVRAILLRGAGKSFCSGMDVAMIGQRAEGDSDLAYLARLQAVRLKQVNSVKPIVAALKGAVFGLGAEIALACSVRIAADDLKFAVPEVDMGLVTDSGGMPLLHAIVGPARARYLILTAARIDAATALAWGAVEIVTTAEAVEDEALAIAQRIAAKPPLAVMAVQRILADLDQAAIRSGLSAELFAQSALFATADYSEAKRAFKARKTPTFAGC